MCLLLSIKLATIFMNVKMKLCSLCAAESGAERVVVHLSVISVLMAAVLSIF